MKTIKDKRLEQKFNNDRLELFIATLDSYCIDLYGSNRRRFKCFKKSINEYIVYEPLNYGAFITRKYYEPTYSINVYNSIRFNRCFIYEPSVRELRKDKLNRLNSLVVLQNIQLDGNHSTI